MNCVLFEFAPLPLAPPPIPHAMLWYPPVKLMSLAAQHYLKELLNDLKVIAWQRRGGLSTDLLSGMYGTRKEAVSHHCGWRLAMLCGSPCVAVGHAGSDVLSLSDQGAGCGYRKGWGTSFIQEDGGMVQECPRGSCVPKCCYVESRTASLHGKPLKGEKGRA